MKKVLNVPAVIFEIKPETTYSERVQCHLRLHDLMVIPEENPDVEQIVTITVNVEIVNTSISDTDGRTLHVEGKLHQNIEYVADMEGQPICEAHFVLPFKTGIALDRDSESCLKFEVRGYVEDVFVRQLDKRKIIKNVLMLLNAVSIPQDTKR